MSEHRPGPVAFLGTGIMGLPMARNLAAAGYDVRAWNRSHSRAEPLAEHGVRVCATAAEAAGGAEVLISMLYDGDSVTEVVLGETGPLSLLAGDAIWLQMTTVGVEAAERLVSAAADAGVDFFDAPVLGTRGPAENAKLVVLASGPERSRKRAAGLFSAMAQRVVWLGEGHQGSALKMVVNSWVLAATAAVSEALALAKGLGLRQDLFLEAIGGTQVDLPYAHIKGAAIMAGNFEANFGLYNAEKDSRLVVEAARSAGVRATVAEAVSAQYRAALEAGYGGADMAAVYHASEATPGPAADPATSGAERSADAERPE